MKRLDGFSVRKVSKIIYEFNLMPSGDSISFLELGEKLIRRLQDGADMEKIDRIVSSELISNYGLDISEDESQKLAEVIYTWYHN